EPAPGAVEPVQRAQGQGRKHPRVSDFQLDRAPHLAVHPPGEHSHRAAVPGGDAADGGARRVDPDGGRRALPPEAGRSAGAALDPLPHAGLLPADRRGGKHGGHAAGGDPGNAADHHLRAPGPRHRQGCRFGQHGEEEAGGVFLMAAETKDVVYRTDELIARDIDAYLERHQHKSLLRFITCGSVDDGKSTLIGRLLYDSKMIFEDQLAALEADSKRVGTQGQEIDFALLVDGLAAEREQGITIDVAYRFFATEKRKFIVADTPGHEQYTRNMVTGASTADLAVILIDARQGVLTQTRRHSFLCRLLGIRSRVLAVNKMDLVRYDQGRFEEIVGDYEAFA